jgi:hypothetical protein
MLLLGLAWCSPMLALLEPIDQTTPVHTLDLVRLAHSWAGLPRGCPRRAPGRTLFQPHFRAGFADGFVASILDVTYASLCVLSRQVVTDAGQQ